jgi:hypothetical protein
VKSPNFKLPVRKRRVLSVQGKTTLPYFKFSSVRQEVVPVLNGAPRHDEVTSGKLTPYILNLSGNG